MRKARSPEEEAALETALSRLDRFARNLEKQNFYSEAKAVRAFLDGEFTSLDQAFGLVPARANPRGRPSKSDAKVILLRKIDGMRKGGTEWKQIIATLEKEQGKTLDERRIRELYSDYKDQIPNLLNLKELAAQLDAEDDSEPIV